MTDERRLKRDEALPLTKVRPPNVQEYTHATRQLLQPQTTQTTHEKGALVHRIVEQMGYRASVALTSDAL